MREIKTDIYRSIHNLPFIVAATAMVFAIALGTGIKQLFPQDALDGLAPYYHANIVLSSLDSDIVLMIIPILCALPFTTAFIDDYTSGYIRPYLMKCDKRRYIRGKVIAAALSGGLCLVIGIMMAYFIAVLIYSPLEIADKTAASPVFKVIGKCLRFFICGALWASMGTLLANISLSKHMAYASPFVVYYVLVILSERYFTGIYVINPKEWLKMEHYWPLGVGGVILLTLILTIIISMMNETAIERRISE